MDSLYRDCRLCPRDCGVDRAVGRPGVCGEADTPRLAVACLHFGEEPALTGRGGSGTLFFTGCTLRCSFCQNHQLSRGGYGVPITAAELARLMLRLQVEGAANINLVTGSHFTPHILEAVGKARQAGLSLPIVWNSSGYESLTTVERLLPAVDVFLPDLKTLDSRLSARLFRAPDYPQAAREALLSMAEKPLRFDAAGSGEGLLRSGLIVRHLVLPGLLDSTRAVLEWYAAHLKERALLSLMVQYTPVDAAAAAGDGAPGSADLARRVSRYETRTVLEWLEELDIEEGFVQEAGAGDDWLPDFRQPSPFPSALSRVVWHAEGGER